MAKEELLKSHQQEQPDKSFCEENCKGYRDTGGKCFFGFDCSAKKVQEQPKVDLVAELKHHLATTPKEQLEKEWKELEPWDNIGPTLHEFLYGKQPEVDLEEITKFSRIKELSDGFEKDWLKYYHTDEEYNSAKFFHLSTIEREYIIARHFYELGLNARKEDT